MESVEARKEQRQSWPSAERKEWKTLRVSLEEKNDVAHLPTKALDMMWQVAYEDGHSEGRHAVKRIYEDLVDIVKEAMK